jgi:AraC-like DNA-binding protein
MIRARRLFESGMLTIERIDHPADAPHRDPDAELSPHYSINVLQRGHFRVTHRGRTWRVGTTDLFVTAPGQVHRYEHDERDHAPEDVCIAVSFNDTLRDDVRRHLGMLVAPVVPFNNRLAYLRQRLLEHVSADVDSMTLDAVGSELLAASLEPTATRLYRPDQLSWYARRVDAARDRLDHDYASDHTLGRLARDAGMSPFHFARVFRELAGVPPHRYLVRRRLAAAAQQLRDGASVTDTCFAVGFQSLSHFITAFRRAFGVSPSRISRQSADGSRTRNQ